jgi:ribosomal protein L25 (general stress protein Ctc)
MTDTKLNVTTRENAGKKWAKKIRRDGQIPGIFYQHGQKTSRSALTKRNSSFFCARKRP